MKITATNERIYVRFRAVAFIAVLIGLLLGGLFHHHEDASQEAACPYCHTGVQAPVPDLARILPTPFFTVVAVVSSNSVSQWTPVLSFSTLIPRAPPAATLPVVFWESCGSLA